MAEQVSSAKAKVRIVCIVPRKTCLIIDLIRGKSVAEALAILQLTPRAASPVVEEVPKSAITNIEHNYNLEDASLYVPETYVNEGATLKRFRSRVRGAVPPVNKRTSHVAAVVSEKSG